MSAIIKEVIQLQQANSLYINGQWVAPVKGGTIQVVSPHTDAVTAVVAEATEEDVNKAVAAARQAFDAGPWPRMPPKERAHYLRKLASALAARNDDLARAWTDQVGALAIMAPMMTGGTQFLLNFYAGLGDTFAFVEERPPTDGQGKAYVSYEAVGVVAAIAPWNAPLMIMINKVAPALLAGCAVIMKPSPETPLEAYMIAEAAHEAGLPAGVLNLLPAHREASDYLVRHHGVDKVSFTGSTVAGRRIAAVCGERIARCTLELGGKSAAVVLEDYDVEAAAQTLAQAISIMSGQVCATLSRVVVPRKLHAAYADAISSAMQQIRVGDPNDPASHMGPLAMRRQLDRVEEYIKRGVAEGANLLHGGNRPEHLSKGCYINPTLFGNVDSKMAIAQEEIFGPVIALLPYDSEADALRIANDSNYGLFGAVFTHDADAAYRIARGVRTGALSHNAFKLDSLLPFGGFKQSGIGREGGLAGLYNYTETKTILLETAPTAI